MLQHWRQRVNWVSLVLFTAVVLSLIGIWGTAALALLVTFGPPLFAWAIKVCLGWVVVIGAGLVLTAALMITSRLRVARLHPAPWAQYPPLPQDPGRERLPANEQQRVAGEDGEQMREHIMAECRWLGRALRFWGSVLVVLCLELAGQYHLRPDSVPVFGMAVAFSITTAVLVAFLGQYVYLRWRLRRARR